MHIKQVIIQGFASYREQTVLEPFSQGHNVIVGKNGSGKSNFFKAIRFILGDLLSSNRSEDKLKLLHEGTGQHTNSAFVEIIFDNSDHRFPSEKDEVVIKREIGAKKDEYSLDRKATTKADIQSMLETVGFSRSNPYYIVQQGKITGMSTMGDEDRLGLLKEVAGTRVYDERREESMKIMKETEQKRKQIEEQYTYIADRLKELEEEKEDLKMYQTLDKQRRSLEYTLWDKETKEANAKIEEIDEARANQVKLAQNHREKLGAEEEELAKHEKNLSEIQDQLKKMKSKQAALDVDARECHQIKTKARIALDDATEAVSGTTEKIKATKTNLQKIEKSIEGATGKMEALEQQYDTDKEREEQIGTELEEKERKREHLFAKQGRQEKFTSKAERDKHLSAEINKGKKQLQEARKSRTKEDERVSAMQASSSELEASMQTLQDKIATLKDEGSGDVAVEHKALKKRQDELTNNRKALWREENNITQEMRQCDESMKDVNKQLNTMMPRNIRDGLQTAKRLVDTHKIKGVHAPIIELIECEAVFARAVEVTAGNRLFNIVVDNDDVAAKMLDLMNKEKNSGRITFMPLNRLQNQRLRYPESPDVLPMVKKLKYDPQYEEAMQQIFGKTLICKNLDVANTYARKHSCDTITIDGDQCNKRGVFTGGSHDHKHLRMSLVAERRSKAQVMEQHQARRGEVENEMKKIEAELNSVSSKMLKVDDSRHNRRYELSTCQAEIKARKGDMERQKALLVQKAALCQKLKQTEEEIIENIQTLEEEVASPMVSGLTAEEQTTLEELSKAVPKLKKAQVKAKSQRSMSESKFSAEQERIENNLKQQKEGLEKELAQLEAAQSSQSDDGDLALYESEMQQAESAVAAAAARQVQHDAEKKSIQKEKQEAEKACEQHRQQIRSMKDVVDGEAKDLETHLRERSALQTKAEESSRKIQKLGMLPADYAQYADKDSKKLAKMLGKCQTDLKKYSHVNKKALDQYVQFTEQCEALNERKNELDSGSTAIQQLITTLDHKKNEAILRTFKGVSKHFSNVFQELVPSGKAALVMKRRKDLEEDGAQGQQQQKSAVETFGGVSIKVSFTGHGEQQVMKQLSGGQKSIVALALVFAIQRCDPAPFYLFDEIDAALDPVARSAVAQMIQRQSDPTAESPTQFIVTTFRNEMVQTAEKHYMVTFQNKVSKVKVVSKRDALACVNAT